MPPMADGEWLALGRVPSREREKQRDRESNKRTEKRKRTTRKSKQENQILGKVIKQGRNEIIDPDENWSQSNTREM